MLMRSEATAVHRIRPARRWSRRVPVVDLEQGCTWFEVREGARSACRVQTASVSVAASRATFLVTVESEGSCFVVVLEGAVAVSHASSTPQPMGALQAVHTNSKGMSAVSGVREEELARDPWVAANRLHMQSSPVVARVRQRAPALVGLLGALGMVAVLGLLAPRPAVKEVTLLEGRGAVDEPVSEGPLTNPSTAPSTTSTTSTTILPEALSPSSPISVPPPTTSLPPPTASVAPPLPAQPSVLLRHCRVVPGGSISVGGTLINPDPVRRHYDIGVQVTDRSGAVRQGTKVLVIADAHEEVVWSAEIPSFAERAGGRCLLERVEVLQP
jgi:hypothetical protein